MIDRQTKKNAYLYCKFRDEQFAEYDHFAKENGMLMNTFLVLNTLYYAKEGLTQNQICENTHQSKQTISLIIKNLLKEGYICTVDSDRDKRSYLVVLTEAGRTYAKEPVTHITSAEDEAMAMFTPEEQEQLVQLSRTFTQNLIKLIRDKL